MGELHLAVNWECLNEGNGIASTLTSHFALWHKSCRDAFNSTKLERIIKRKMPEESHGQSSSKRTRSSIFPESVKHSVCFFCEESANVGDLRMACTMDMDSRVRSVARKLSDFRLISKLNTTDTVAIGAKYLTRFLAALYNRAREHDKESSSELNSQSETHSMVLADLIAEIQNSRHGQQHITVFKLSDLRKEYCKRLIREGLAEETQEIHSTRICFS